MGDVLNLCLSFPATPGPCTLPRTSWRTSATCSMTWLTSWTRCWTEACSLLPFPLSSCSASVPHDGGVWIRHQAVPPGLSSRLPPHTLHCGWERGRPSALTPGSIPHLPARAAFRGVRHFPPDWQLGREPAEAAHVVLEAMEEPSFPCTEPRSLHKGPFSSPLQSCLLLFIPCQQCVKGETSPGSRHRAGYLLSSSQPGQGLTAANRRQGLSQTGSLRAGKEPFCFICCFSKRISVRQRVIQVDPNPSSGTHKALETGLAQPAKQRMLCYGPARHGCLPTPSLEPSGW